MRAALLLLLLLPAVTFGQGYQPQPNGGIAPPVAAAPPQALLNDGGTGTQVAFYVDGGWLSGSNNLIYNPITGNTSLGSNSSLCVDGLTCAATAFQYSGGWGFHGPIVTNNTLDIASWIQSASARVVVANGNNQRLQNGSDAGTTGALSVTFTSAYTGTNEPNCTCADINGTTPVACGVKTTGSIKTGVTFLATGAGSDVISWICSGER